MSIHFTKSNHFKSCELEFPRSTSCSTVFNRLFVDGLSFNDFEANLKRTSKSTIALQIPAFQHCTQYNIKEDIWGPKEILLLAKQGNDFDACLVYGIRDAGEFSRVESFLKNDDRCRLIHDKPGNRVYDFNIHHWHHPDNRKIQIGIVRDSEQSSKVNLLLNF